ncbi:MAG: DUF2961 domain-containing protein, partial [Candidatus Sumerlaeota bacterium]
TEDTGLFHARFNRNNPCPMHEDYVLLDGAEGPGVFLGAVIGIRSLMPGWWGEGEVKFYIDDDGEWPTICGTGAEDYIGSAWGLGRVCTPWQGAALVDAPYYSIYRFHHRDPIYFQTRLRATVQQIGFSRRERVKDIIGADKWTEHPPAGAQKHADNCMFERSDDWCSVAYWYQATPGCPATPLPDHENRSAHLYTDQETAKRADEE